MNSGVYKIVNKQTGTAYIGASGNLKVRKSNHFNTLSRGKHSNPNLQAAYNESAGNTAFDFAIIETCSLEDLPEREEYHIAATEDRYNIVSDARRAGCEASKASRAKMAEAKKGTFKSAESKSKVSGEQHYKFAGWFVTPFGRHASTCQAEEACNGAITDTSIRKFCRESNTLITKKSYRKSPFLQSLGPAVINRTYADLGFGFEPVAN